MKSADACMCKIARSKRNHRCMYPLLTRSRTISYPVETRRCVNQQDFPRSSPFSTFRYPVKIASFFFHDIGWSYTLITLGPGDGHPCGRIVVSVFHSQLSVSSLPFLPSEGASSCNKVPTHDPPPVLNTEIPCLLPMIPPLTPACLNS